MKENDKPINEAKTLLLEFKQHKTEELEKALEIINKHESPEHYEEWGKINDKDYFYTKDIYQKARIIIHKNNGKISNVELSCI